MIRLDSTENFDEKRRDLDISEDRRSVHEIVNWLSNHKNFKENISKIVHFPSQPGQYEQFPSDLDPKLVDVIVQRGIDHLYSHQAEAWRMVTQGKNIVLQTPTASGKTLAYNLPVLQAILNDPSSKALYIFPTKALSQDQVAELYGIITALNEEIKVFTFDGDTPQNARIAIRKKGHVVVTNPDMLHQGILPHHTRWISFFQNLKYIVIDETHSYRGVFGSHFANVIRRLRRILAFYGADPVFICCSATIANPVDHVQALIEDQVTLINKSGSPSNERYILFFNPPVVNKELGIRASYIKQTRALAKLLIQSRIQSIVFALSRLNVEVLTKYLKDDFERKTGVRDELIVGYRGGYLPKRRRSIEKGLREGRIKGVVATNALELGVDIGSLDGVIVAGYPGSIASTWQQFGRAGRRGDVSMAILVGRSHPVDQFIMVFPDFFFGKSPESARINPNNLIILVEHIKCAGFELPFDSGETFGKVSWPDLREVLNFLSENKVLQQVDERWHWTSDVYPAAAVNLRRIPEGNFVVVDSADRKTIIAEVDYSTAPMTIYPDAIYLADGQQYIVDELDWDGRKAYVRKTDSDYYTDSIDYTNIKVLDIHETRESNRVEVEYGDVQAVTKVAGFKKIKFYTMENVGYGKINLPDFEFATTSYWFTITERIFDDLPYSHSDIIDGVLGIAYAMHSVASLLLMCEPHDIHRSVGDKSAEWYIRHSHTERGIYSSGETPGSERLLDMGSLKTFRPAIFLYDNYPGGIGFSQELFDRHRELIEQTHKLIVHCSCSGGCPACVGPALEVGKRSKQVAGDILEIMLR